MTAGSTGFHEQEESLTTATKDRHRAIVSVMEEMEAVDWYDQRVEAATDPELAAILAHNRDEEKEHAAMVLEWLRRNDKTWDEELRANLFKDGPIVDHGPASAAPGAAAHGAPGAAAPGAGGSLGIGSLRGKV